MEYQRDTLDQRGNSYLYRSTDTEVRLMHHVPHFSQAPIHALPTPPPPSTPTHPPPAGGMARGHRLDDLDPWRLLRVGEGA